MRSLSAHHFRLTRQVLPAARAYRDEIERTLAGVGVHQLTDFRAAPGLLLVVSDLGLCGDYNTRLVQAAIAQQAEQAEGPLYCIGHRPRAMLQRHHLEAARVYRAPTSVDGLPGLLIQLAQDLLDDLRQARFGSLSVVSARFEGAGSFSPVITHVLPARPPQVEESLRPTPYQSYRRLAAVALREFLYITLYELLLDSLASEHGMRLLAAESARKWLEETTATVHRRLIACHREAATQEVLDIVAGSRTKRSLSVGPE
jgi:F-type H+-transporting ATPase subunit gamma